MFILPPSGKKTTLSNVLSGSLTGLGDAFEQYAKQKKMDEAKAKQDEQMKKAGYGDLIGLEPQVQKLLLSDKLEQQKLDQPFESNEQGQPSSVRNINYDMYKNFNPDQKAKFSKSRPKDAVIYEKAFQDEQKKLNKTEKLSPFETQKQRLEATEQVKRISKAKEQIPIIQAQINNLNYLKKLGNEIGSGVLPNKIGGAMPYNEKNTEFNSLATTAIEPIIKIFNPVGPIPVQKFTIIQREFAPRSTDTNAQRTGKINALDRIYQQALERNQNYVNLVSSYDGNVPEDVKETITNESLLELDKIIQEEKDKIAGKEKSTENEVSSPKVGEKVGQRLQNPKTGEIAEWNGKEWLLVQ